MTNVRFLPSTYSPPVCFNTLLSTKSTLRDLHLDESLIFCTSSVLIIHSFRRLTAMANSVRMHFCGLKLNFQRLYLICRTLQPWTHLSQIMFAALPSCLESANVLQFYQLFNTFRFNLTVHIVKSKLLDTNLILTINSSYFHSSNYFNL